MLIKIEPDIFEKKGNEHGLTQLFGIAFYKGRYNLFVELSQVMETPHYQTILADDKSVLEGMFNKSIQEGLKPDLVISDENDSCFSLDEALRILNQPLKIVVENSANDAHFVNAIMKCFGGKEFLRHKNNGWIEFRNAGGATNTINVFKELLRAFRILPKPNQVYLRAFVIMDSDKFYPTMTLEEDNNNKARTIEFLEENKIPYHILEKREIENYLPDEVIDTISDYREFIDAYLRLNSIQKDYFDLEKGFPNKRFAQLSQEIQDLYDDISDEDKKIFRKKDLTEYPDGSKKFKSEFPKLFNNKLITKDTLLDRCKHHDMENNECHPYNPNELPDLVEKIIALL